MQELQFDGKKYKMSHWSKMTIKAYLRTRTRKRFEISDEHYDFFNYLHNVIQETSNGKLKCPTCFDKKNDKYYLNNNFTQRYKFAINHFIENHCW